MKIKLSQLDLPAHDLREYVDEDALDELAASMREVGQLQPIGVKPTAGDRYEVVFGARRTRAARINSWEEIEGNIVEDTGTHTAEAKKLIENVQRLDMTPVEESMGLMAVIGNDEPNIRELQKKTGKSRDWIRSRLEIAVMPEDLQDALQIGDINIAVARAFAKIGNVQVREQYLGFARDGGCTGPQAEIWASQAHFAETGIMSMEEIQRTGLDLTEPPPIVDQHYPCFICTIATNWRRVNVLPICGTCQDAVTSERTKQ
jgi:ParB/RepB/Spo0J family partition protein